MLVWLGAMGIADERPGVGSIGAGAILLLGAMIRKSQGHRAGAFLPLVGVLLVLMGINDLGGDDRGIPFLATALIAFGALVLVRALSVPRNTHGPGLTITFGEPDRDPPRR